MTDSESSSRVSAGEYVRDGAYRWQTIDLDRPRADSGGGPRKAAPELPGILDQGRRDLLDRLGEVRRRTGTLKVAELGAGDGSLSVAIANEYPDAVLTLVDTPATMMSLATERLEPHQGRWNYVSWHPGHGDWPSELEGPFDAIVSFLAVHHLENEAKAQLFAGIRDRLRPGGVFANFDMFRYPHAEFDLTVPQQLHDSLCATLQESREYLGAAGFGEVNVTDPADRPTHKGEMALVVATTGEAR